jgi:hypothetical protein
MKLAVIFTALMFAALPAWAEDEAIDSQRLRAAVTASLMGSEAKEFLPSFYNLLLRESGFIREEFLRTFQLDLSKQAAVARAFRQADALFFAKAARGDKTIPAEDLSETPKPDALLAAIPLALAYAANPEPGLRAAGQCAPLLDDDPHAEACAQAAFVLLTYALRENRPGETSVVRLAADRLGDEYVAKNLLSSRSVPFRRLPEENTACGKLCRAVWFWYRYENLTEEEKKKTELKTETAKIFLRALLAASRGIGVLPQVEVKRLLHREEMAAIVAGLLELAEVGILQEVPEVIPPPVQTASSASLTENETPARPAAPASPAASLDEKQPDVVEEGGALPPLPPLQVFLPAREKTTSPNKREE